jgi:hypothetical protein
LLFPVITHLYHLDLDLERRWRRREGGEVRNRVQGRKVSILTNIMM